MHLTHRKTCRVCGSSQLTEVIDLGEQYLQGSFVKPGKKSPPMRKIPVRLVRCDATKDEKACGLLQMLHTVPPEVLYSTYWYRSGTNRTMREHLEGIAKEASELVGKGNAKVLDIGCNDGTLLRSYPKAFVKFGVDPSEITAGIDGDIRVIRDLFPSPELTKETKGEKFDIITAIAMFYDLEDPVSFVRDVKENLAPEGVWVFEMSYMPLMLKMNSYDTICHEHLEYYSLAVIETILKKAGMKLVRVGLNDINGGSIRCYAAHVDNFKFTKPEFLEEIKALRQEEFDLELDTDKPYRDFQRRIDAHREELVKLLKELKRKGKKVHVYGASTKGNTILQFCGINHSTIDCAADRNPDKHGALTLGTDIPIVSEEESRAMKPDYYLALPWHFRKEFIERERETLAKGIRMIFPLPKVEVVSC
ncbi:MAG: class I SAM-dependent methyltransferase [Candidatus Omnitrophica bacterium]|nr:class I SAM-dependent methyltransferase [Candidatus Omnitrophota bacterium]